MTISERTLPNTNAGRLWTLHRMRSIITESAGNPVVRAWAMQFSAPLDFMTWWPAVWIHVPDETDQTIKWPRAQLEELSAHGGILAACAGLAVMYGTVGVVHGGRVELVGISQGDYEVLDHVWAEWNGVPYDPIMPTPLGVPYDRWTVQMRVAVSARRGVNEP